ncbi:MAG: M1 family metallopeptidase [Clostridiales bacterium]|jgi:aminopeptidase N|nr:M1 family metallopeptidase [Clostridiales bacterium]
MKFFRKILVVAALACVCVLGVGCAEKGAGDASANLSRYTIDAVFDDAAKTLTAVQSVEYVNNYDVELNDLYFHLYPAAYREGARFTPFNEGDAAGAFPNGKSYGGIEIKSVKVNGTAQTPEIGGQDEDILIVKFADCLMPTSRTTVEIEYAVKIPEARHRLGHYDGVVNLGNFYPVACVYENGEFKSDPYYSNGDPFYSQAANYDVSITAPIKYTAAMSGLSIVTDTKDTRKSSAMLLAARDFAVVLGEFKQKTTTADGAGVYYYYRDDVSPDVSLGIAAAALKTFNSMFGKYPYATLSVVQTPFLNSGMEYPGLVYVSDRESGEFYRDVIVHETAHQWWYGVVGNNQVENAWLDETLAEYSATLFYEANPDYGVDYGSRIADALTAYALFCDFFEENSDTSMNRRLPDFKTPHEYAMMTYTKGQVMMDSLRKTIGDGAFFAALKKYYDDNYLKIAAPDNLIGCFESAAKRDLSQFFATWIDGKVVTFNKY